ncbi:Wzz/FepE/Etk N-terminal domain-containing protein [Thermodesulfovibrionales bacterium]|nr:Wzz/FepE/Etk N-terminal domain-containing protein [Thermodesulfovibrionales bacterium]
MSEQEYVGPSNKEVKKMSEQEYVEDDVQDGRVVKGTRVKKMSEQEYVEDEINLRDYIKVILKRKKLILTVFLVAVITTTVVSLLLPRVYEATTSIMIMPSRLPTALSPTQISLDVLDVEGERAMVPGRQVIPRPAIAIPTHGVLLKSNTVLERIIDRLKLTDQAGKRLTPGDLKEQLNVEEIRDTNILRLEVERSNPRIAKEIANAWAEEYLKYSHELISGEVEGMGDFIVSQFEIARENLIQSEKAVKDFDIKEGISLMRIKLREKQSELDSNYANVHKLEFQLAERTRFLQKINENITAMTKDGVWLGSFSPKSFPREHFMDKNLSASQRSLRQETLEAKFDLEEAQEKYNNFVNDSGIELLRQRVVNKRKNLLNDKSTLAEVRRLSETTEANLKSGGTLDRLRRMRGPISQDLIDSTVWEILSLEERYNFFKSRQQFLESKIEREEVGLRALEKTLFEYENELKTLSENLNRAKANYNFYLKKFKSFESAKNSTKLEIAAIEFQLSLLKKFVERLEEEVKTLKKEINRKEIELTQLTRQEIIYQRTFDNLAIRLEEARIAKAMELGEVRIVSPAIEPESPIRPKKKLNVAISGVLGLMFGVFIAFSREFLEKNKTKS